MNVDTATCYTFVCAAMHVLSISHTPTPLSLSSLCFSPSPLLSHSPLSLYCFIIHSYSHTMLQTCQIQSLNDHDQQYINTLATTYQGFSITNVSHGACLVYRIFNNTYPLAWCFAQSPEEEDQLMKGFIWGMAVLAPLSIYTCHALALVHN